VQKKNQGCLCDLPNQETFKELEKEGVFGGEI